MPYLSYAGHKLHFTDSGGAGEPVLLLHGLGSRARDWQPQITGLINNFRVIALDFPGHGSSSPLKAPTTMVELAGGVRALLDHLAIDRAHVVGLSLGGMVLFQCLVDQPERLQSATVINSGPGLTSGRWRMKLLVAFRTLLIRSLGLPALARYIAPKLFPKPDQQQLREDFMASIAEADKDSYLYILRAIGNFNVLEKISGSDVPALILSADQDYTPVAYKEAYTAQLANARLAVIHQSGHASPMDKPETCTELIRNFVQENSVKRTQAAPRSNQ